jgi:anti-anti-sigma factor
MSTHQSSEPSVSLGPDMTIVEAADTHRQLISDLEKLSLDPRLDLSAVTEFDSSGVQLLLALRASLGAKGQTLQLHRPSAAVTAALKTFGLQEQFPLCETTGVH